MSLISRSIPNLIGGVSQQPEVLRLENQATTQENGFSGVVEGLKKRPPTNYIAKITNEPLTNAYIHTINRDVTERYIVVITDGNIAVYTTDGTAKTVVSQTNASNYLSSSNPREDFKCLTVNDYTYVVNKQKTVAMDSGTTSPAKVEQAVYTVVQGVGNSTTSTPYSITIDGTTYTYSSATVDTKTIRDGLKSAVGTPTNITTADIGNSSFSITKSTGTLSVSASDGFGDQASQVVYDEVQNFSDLPGSAPNNMVVEVKGDATSTFDNYYVKYFSSTGVWEETVAPGIETTLDEDTMPHVLIRSADGNFRFSQVDGSSYTISATSYDVPSWGTRIVGDLDSSPNPSFVGAKLKDIFFHRNRLGLLANENVILSRSSEFFEFFNETVTDALDTEVIDINVAHTKVSLLKHAVAFDEKLLLFSDQTQFVLTGGTSLTPGNISVNVTTEYENYDTVSPIGSGNNVFFGFNKGQYTGVREMYVESDGETNQGEDITSSIPKYIPSEIYKFAIASNENILVTLSNKVGDRNRLYIYQWFIAQGKRLQSAWHKWIIGDDTDTIILNVDFIGTTLYLIVERSDGTYIETIDCSPAVVDSSATYLTYLDRKLDNSQITQSYNSMTNLTTITLPYYIDSPMKVVGKAGGSNKAGQDIAITTQSGTTITVSGDITTYDYFIGEQYTFLYTFSQQYLALGQNTTGTGSRTRIKEGRLQIRNWTISFNDTGYFESEVTPFGRDTSNTTWTGTIVGKGLAGTVNLEDGDYTFAVQSKNENLTISLKNSTHLPSNFVHAEWEGYYVSHATFS
tara:strand:- start:4891 stop:7284 length:2394 start_codon:yes stop_codon:yes gene_type:complete